MEMKNTTDNATYTVGNVTYNVDKIFQDEKKILPEEKLLLFILSHEKSPDYRFAFVSEWVYKDRHKTMHEYIIFGTCRINEKGLTLCEKVRPPTDDVRYLVKNGADERT